MSGTLNTSLLESEQDLARLRKELQHRELELQEQQRAGSSSSLGLQAQLQEAQERCRLLEGRVRQRE